MGFSNSIICPITFAKGTNEHYSLRLDKSSRLHKAGINTPSQLKRNIQRTQHKLFAVPLGNFHDDMGPLSPAQTVMSFYSAINEKNLKQVDEIIAEDCFFEDYSFPKPFRGKKEVLHFLGQLITCMGPNMQFNVERISEGNENSVGVNWHLVIEKAQVLIESPIKLGLVALVLPFSPLHMIVITTIINCTLIPAMLEPTIFRIVTSLFDAFPAATEVLNESAHCVSTTATDIQDNRTACDEPIPSVVHQITKNHSLHYQLHTQNTSPPSRKISQVNEQLQIQGSKGQPMVREMEKVAVAY
ncbi:hypothetical protein OROHE_009536 [Orobanche hederae]